MPVINLCDTNMNTNLPTYISKSEVRSGFEVAFLIQHIPIKLPHPTKQSKYFPNNQTEILGDENKQETHRPYKIKLKNQHSMEIEKNRKTLQTRQDIL